MDILFHVATAEGARILLPLARACRRAGRSFACFFTNDGVAGLNSEALQEALRHAERAAACEESWHRFGRDEPCPIELGSQTANSALMGEAARVISL